LDNLTILAEIKKKNTKFEILGFFRNFHPLPSVNKVGGRLAELASLTQAPVHAELSRRLRFSESTPDLIDRGKRVEISEKS
jgi:hypothetical protein